MNLPRSSFYYKPRSQSPERMEAEADLRDKLRPSALSIPATVTVGLPMN